MSSEFETWLAERLGQFNADGDVFSSYILGILDGEEPHEEKETNLSDLLEGLGLDDGNPDPCLRIQTEIWKKWKSVNEQNSEKNELKDAKNCSDLGAALAAHAENQTKAYVASKGQNSSSSNDKDREAVKAAILAQYDNIVEGSDDDGEEEEDDGGDLMDKNTNAENVAKAQVEQREKSKAAAQAKKDKDKEDREKQKKDAEDRKKKAQEKAAKGERKR